MQVDLVIATYNRAEQLRETLQNVLATAVGINKVYVVNNASTDHTRELLDGMDDGRIVAIHNERNLGAAAGKNVGLRRSEAELIIVLDDDALFCSEDPVGEVRRLFAEERLGVVQFKIINFQTGRVLRYEFPGDDPERRADTQFPIGYFIGAGHAIRKRMLEEVGYYPDDFGLYAHEEVDLSYRAVNHGYTMRYAPSVAVQHKKAPGGRLPPRDVLHHMLLNRLVMTRKYLPAPYSLINNLLWLLRTALVARSPALAFAAYRAYRARRPAIARQTLTREAMAYLFRNHGRVFR
jgi:GT2 family glycosyltransferase